MITIPSLSDVTDILDTDLVMVTNAQGQSYKIAGSELNKRNKIIIASSTTVTGTPLKAGWPVRIYFSADITAANASTAMQINYNNVNYYVKVPKNGALVNFVANAVGNTYKYVQAYTTLELLFDGTQFVIMGNPIVISSADYTIYADGLKRVDTVEVNNKNMVTSNAVSTALKNTLIPNTQLFNVTGYYKFKHRQAYGRTSNFKVILGLNVIELAMYKADGNMTVSAVQEGELTAGTTFQLGYDDTYLYIKKTNNATGYAIQAYSLTNGYSPIGELQLSNQTEFDNSTKINISDYENKATLWENTLVSICNASVLQAGKEVSFTVNTTSIADLPVANRGIVTTRKNILDNRAIQMYFCIESTNNDIYYRYLEWNGTYWMNAIGWKKITSTNV